MAANLPLHPDFNQRIEFLLQSTESLHSSVQELHAASAEQGRNIDKIVAASVAQDARLDKLLTVAEGLARIAQGHEKRLTNLEGPPS